MVASRYTRQQLFILRNHIPIDRVFDALDIPSSIQAGQYRFSCPVCNGQNTGINPKTNLARCFNCKKNYNTIDIVMKVMDVGFIESVAYLEKLKADTQSPIGPQKACRRNEMVHIGSIFKSLISTKPGDAVLDHPPKNDNQTITDLEKRVSDLEHQITLLTRKIALLHLK